MIRWMLMGVALTGWLAAAAIAPAESQDVPDVAASPVGRKVENFTLKDYRGRERSLSDHDDSPLVVVAFLGTKCPLAKLYGPRLAALSDEYAGRGVAFVGINANRQDSITEIAAYARIHGIEFPVLKDLGNQVADAMGAVRTPEVFVLDSQRTVRYWGRIDDQYGIGYARDEPTRRDLALALDQLLAGKPVEIPVTPAPGCYIGRVREANDDGPVTYANQIARILQKRCVECHRPGEIAPFSLLDYDEIAGWAETIDEVVREDRMPPWHADPRHGKFANDRRMSDEEKDLIYRWVADGAPQGDPADLPEPVEFVEGWQLREPDLVVKMRDRPYQVPAEGAVAYQYFTVDPDFIEDKWVRMAEVRPGNRAVVHHILVAARPPSGAPSGAGGGDFIAGYVPGLRAKPYPDGMAKLVPAGSKLVFQVHYTPNGSPQEDLSEIGFLFAEPDEIDHVVVTTKAVQSRLRIPPHEPDHRVEAVSRSHSDDVLLLSLMPHMHLRGKSFRYEALFPDGTTEILLDVPRYDFNWQTSYRLAEPRPMPAGTRMRCVAHFDNSADNLANPDPTQTVTWGDQTWNEMMIGYFDIAVPLGEAAPARRRGGAAEARRALVARAGQLLRRFDRDGDGRISRDEVPAQLLPVFDQLDTNGDGVVTEEELIEGLDRLPPVP